MAKQNDADRKYVLEHTQEWLDDFLTNPGIQAYAENFKISDKRIREIIREYSLAMCDEFGRRPRRWTGTATEQIAQEHYRQLSADAWRETFVMLGNYFGYLQEEGHINNADALLHALTEFGGLYMPASTDAYLDDIQGYDGYNFERYDDGTGLNPNPRSGFDPDDVLDTLAEFYGLQRGSKLDNDKFMQEHFSEFVLLAEGADGMDLMLCNAIADGYGRADMKYITDWFKRIVMPDINLSKMLDGQQPPKNQREMDALINQLVTSFMVDTSPLPTDLRMQFAAQLDGDSLANPGGEQRFMSRHAAVLQEFFDIKQKPAQPAPKQNKPAKIISFDEARRRLQAEEK